MSLDDSAYASINLDDSNLNIDDGMSLDDSAFVHFNLENFDINSDDEILPSEEEFAVQIRQNCLTSTDEKED